MTTPTIIRMIFIIGIVCAAVGVYLLGRSNRRLADKNAKKVRRLGRRH